MRKNTSKINRIFKKAITAVMAVAITFTAVTGFGFQKAQAAETQIISDENATAYINADGSGYIELKKEFTSKNSLKSIDGVALKDIIKFNDGGYIDEFYAESDYHPSSGTIADLIDYISPYIIRVHGRGPEGFFSGSGYLHFTDETNDTYNLSIWRHSESWHYVRYDSDQPTIVKISWNN